VFASSEAGGSEPDNVGLQFLTIPATANCLLPDGTVYADFANTHNYVCGHLSAPVDNNAWNAEDPTLNSSWDSLYVEYGDTWHEHFAGYSDPQLITLPRVTTETGWATQGSNSITEAQQGAIFLDLYLDAFKRGWSYTFIYMLRDDPVQGYWGLVHTDYTPKGSGTYLHNFTTILADAPSTVADSLNYSIPNEPATVHDLLLEKANGTYELAVWDENASGSDSVTVNLGTTYSSINLYDPTIGPTPTQTLSNVNAVPLTLSNHPMIIEIPALTVQGAVSRKTHGSAGDFDLPINVIAGTEPVPGAAPVECRVGTNLELVVTFDRNVTAANAEINLGTASLDTTTCSGNQVILDLSDVTNAQSLQIGLSDVQGEDGSVLANATMSLSILIGDTDGNGIVSAADMRVVRDDLGTSGGDSDFSPRADCGTLGVVSARDMAIVRDNFGTSLPSSP
jgi:hypothetical protein